MRHTPAVDCWFREIPGLFGNRNRYTKPLGLDYQRCSHDTPASFSFHLKYRPNFMSVLVDGFHIAKQLRKDEPEVFELPAAGDLRIQPRAQQLIVHAVERSKFVTRRLAEFG